MADPKIRIRRSATPNKVPLTSQLQLGELAINTFDGKLYLEKDQTGSSGIATVIVVNPWSVGLGSLAYDTFFTAGNVGVGTTNPTQLLDVAGDIRLRGAIFDSNNTTGTANQVLVSNAGAGVTWTNLTAIPVGDANTLDGLDSTQFLRSDVADTKAGITTFSDEVILQSNLNVTGVSTFQDDVDVTGNLTVDTNTLFVNATNNRIGIGTTNPAYQVEIENTGANALLVLDRTDGAACFIEGQLTRSAFGSVNATPLALAYDSLAVVTIGAGGSITVNPDGDGFTFPTVDGNANEILQTDGDGNLSFTSSVTFSELNVTGISTLSSAIVGTSVTITSSGLNVTGVVTATSFVGDGSGLTNLPGASVGVNTNTTDQAQIIPFTLGYGTTTGFGATNSFVFNPSTTRLGIGSDAPAYALDVVGDINSSTDVKINGTGVLDTALALAIALG